MAEHHPPKPVTAKKRKRDQMANKKRKKRMKDVDQGKPAYYSRHLIPDLLILPSVVNRSALAHAAAA